MLNFVFLFLCLIIVVYGATNGYFRSGSISLLGLGSGSLSFAVGSLLAGVMLPLRGADASVALHNTSALLAGIFHFFGALAVFAGVQPHSNERQRHSTLVLVYSGILVLMALMALGEMQGLRPNFFLQGKGPTLLRQCVLGTAAILFGASGLLFLRRYRRLGSSFLYRYGMALLLFATGLFCTLFEHSVGGLVSWLGRLTQYVGGIYLFIAVYREKKGMEGRGVRLDAILVKLFRSEFETLLEEMYVTIVFSQPTVDARN